MIQNARVRMLLKNVINDATLTLAAGDALPKLPLDNVKRYSNSRIFRTTTIDEIVIEGKFKGFQSINSLVINRHNFSAIAKIRIEIFGGHQQDGQTLLDTGLINVYKLKTLGELNFGVDNLIEAVEDKWELKYFTLWFDLMTAWSFRITIQDPHNVDGYIEFARIYVSHAFVPEVNFNIGDELAPDTDEKQKRIGKSLHATEGELFRRMAFKFSRLAEADRAQLFENIYDVKKSKDWFISMYPQQGGLLEHHYSMACMFKVLPKQKHHTENLWESPVLVEEC